MWASRSGCLMGLVSSPLLSPCREGLLLFLRRFSSGRSVAHSGLLTSAAKAAQSSHLKCPLLASGPLACFLFFHSISHHLTLNLNSVSPVVL